MQSRKNLFDDPGGDTVQIQETAESLRKLGVEVDIDNALSPDLSRYDLVHLFNIIRPQETAIQARNAAKQGKPVAMSPIFVDFSRYEQEDRSGFLGAIARHTPNGTVEVAKMVGRAIANRHFDQGTLGVVARGYRGSLKAVAREVSVFLPNSNSEMRRLENFLGEGVISAPYCVVPNAVDLEAFDREKAIHSMEFSQYVELQDSVLCVGRVEGRKNQLRLVEALEGTGLKLVIVGRPSPHHKQYYERVRTKAGPGARFFSGLTSRQLAALYCRARVHALPSWMETTGLASLEAAAMGTNIVVSPEGDTREYFGDAAEYCEPSDVQSIREAVLRAYEKPSDPAFVRRLRAQYNWSEAGRATLAAYTAVLRP